MALRRLEQTEVPYGEPIPLRDNAAYTTEIDTLSMANAVGVMALATYLVCAAVAFTSIDLLVNIGQLWFHGMAFSSAPLVFNPVSFVVGGVTMTALAWLLAAATIALYNALRRR